MLVTLLPSLWQSGLATGAIIMVFLGWKLIKRPRWEDMPLHNEYSLNVTKPSIIICLGSLRWFHPTCPQFDVLKVVPCAVYQRTESVL